MLDQIARMQQHEEEAAASGGAAQVPREDAINPQLREKMGAFFSQWVLTLFESERKDPEVRKEKNWVWFVYFFSKKKFEKTCLAILRSIGRSNPELASIINAQNLPHLVFVCTSSVVQTAYQLSAQQGNAVAATSWYK
jgi:hypothetical protein